MAVTVQDPYIELTSLTNYLNVDGTFLFKAKAYGTKEKLTWSIEASGDASATISSAGKLTARAAGTVTVTAKAGKAVKTCEVVIGTNRLGSFTGNISCYTEQTVDITIYEPVEKETLTAVTLSGHNDVIDFEWQEPKAAHMLPITIIPKKAGTDTLVIASDKTTDRLYINVTVTDKPKERAELSAKEIYALCGPATVEISAVTEFGAEYIGSGFFIDKGLIVTNYHVIEGAVKITVKAQDKKEYEVKEIVGCDAEIDLAVLRINSENPFLTISQDGPFAGESIYALGSPLGLTGTISGGMVTTASRTFDGVNYIQIDAPISQGNSGGPLINSYGEVIGVNTMYYVNGQNLNFAVDIDQIYRISTIRPVTVTKYYEEYKAAALEAFEKNKIYEDPAVSQDPLKCQYAPPFTGIVGTIMPTEYGDCYWFSVESPINLLGIISFDDMVGSLSTYFVLYDYDYKYVTSAYVSEKEPTQIMMYNYLLPGDYFVSIYLDEEYIGDPVPYTFVLGYEAAD